MSRIAAALLLAALAAQGSVAQLPRRGLGSRRPACGTLGTSCCDTGTPCAEEEGLICSTSGILRNICITPPPRLPPVEVSETVVEEEGPPFSGDGDNSVEVVEVVEVAPEIPDVPEPVPRERRPRSSPMPEPEPEPMPEPEPEPMPEPEPEPEPRPAPSPSPRPTPPPRMPMAEPMPEPMPKPMPEPMPEPEPKPEEDGEGEVDEDRQFESVSDGERPAGQPRAPTDPDDVETTIEEEMISDGDRNVAVVRVMSVNS